MRRLAIALTAFLGLSGFQSLNNPVFPAGGWRTLTGLTLTAAATPGAFAGTASGTAVFAGKTACISLTLNVTTQDTASLGLYVGGLPAAKTATSFNGTGVITDANAIKGSMAADATQIFVTKYDNLYVGPTGYVARLAGCYEMK